MWLQLRAGEWPFGRELLVLPLGRDSLALQVPFATQWNLREICVHLATQGNLRESGGAKENKTTVFVFDGGVLYIFWREEKGFV